jgi:hypothetical protein
MGEGRAHAAFPARLPSQTVGECTPGSVTGGLYASNPRRIDPLCAAPSHGARLRDWPWPGPASAGRSPSVGSGGRVLPHGKGAQPPGAPITWWKPQWTGLLSPSTGANWGITTIDASSSRDSCCIPMKRHATPFPHHTAQHATTCRSREGQYFAARLFGEDAQPGSHLLRIAVLPGRGGGMVAPELLPRRPARCQGCCSTVHPAQRLTVGWSSCAGVSPRRGPQVA